MAQPAVAGGEFHSADARDMTRMGRVQQLKVRRKAREIVCSR